MNIGQSGRRLNGDLSVTLLMSEIFEVLFSVSSWADAFKKRLKLIPSIHILRELHRSGK
jgi:hypothetical protein